ncbi:hypothetical protein ABPG75_012822 [Micractinium tetrahymenae]
MSDIANLTELCSVGNVTLPPDWRQLSALRALKLRTMEEVDDWGAGLLTALHALSYIELNYVEMPEASMIATAPALAELYVPDLNEAHWLAEVAALRPGVRAVLTLEEA